MSTFTLLHTYVAGVHHHMPGLETWAVSLPHGQRLNLAREPENPHDHNAVKVLLTTRMIGYIPRELAPVVGALLKNGYEVHAEVDDVDVKNKRYPTVGIALVMPSLESK